MPTCTRILHEWIQTGLLGAFYVNLRTVPTNMKVFCTTHGYMGKEDLNMGYWNLKRKLGVTMHFSQLFKLQVGKNGDIIFFPKKKWKSRYFS